MEWNGNYDNEDENDKDHLLVTATHFIEYQLWSDREDSTWVRLNNLTSERTSHVLEAHCTMYCTQLIAQCTT